VRIKNATMYIVTPLLAANTIKLQAVKMFVLMKRSIIVLLKVLKRAPLPNVFWGHALLSMYKARITVLIATLTRPSRTVSIQWPVKSKSTTRHTQLSV